VTKPLKGFSSQAPSANQACEASGSRENGNGSGSGRDITRGGWSGQVVRSVVWSECCDPVGWRWWEPWWEWEWHSEGV